VYFIILGFVYYFFGFPLAVEEVEDVLDLGELLAEVVVDDHKCEDVAAVDEDNEAVEQSHNGESVLQGSNPFLLDGLSKVGKDASKRLRKYSCMGVVLSQVIGDVVVLAVEVERHSDLEGVSDRESRTCVGTRRQIVD
jgi:hypothetical protein